MSKILIKSRQNKNLLKKKLNALLYVTFSSSSFFICFSWRDFKANSSNSFLQSNKICYNFWSIYIYRSLSQLNLCNCQSNTFLTSLFRSWQQAPASIACDCSNCRYIYGCNNLEWKEIKKIIKHPKHVIHFKFVACDKVWYHVAKLNYWCFIFKNIYY